MNTVRAEETILLGMGWSKYKGRWYNPEKQEAEPLQFSRDPEAFADLLVWAGIEGYSLEIEAAWDETGKDIVLVSSDYGPSILTSQPFKARAGDKKGLMSAITCSLAKSVESFRKPS